jgi:hypothetical protein
MGISNLDIETLYVVGAGFSHHAGLPLTSRFTEALLEAREFEGGPSRVLVNFLSEFIHRAFGHSRTASAKYWPDLEDVFTCVDLSANTGHHLGSTFSSADLRTVRRALLARIIRMLGRRYKVARSKKSDDWRKLDDFFVSTSSDAIGFISMNWDTVIERKLEVTRSDLSLDYCCDAFPAVIPRLPDIEEPHRSRSEFLAEIKRGQPISLAAVPTSRKRFENSTPVVKIHGSVNWLYCDNCRRLFWASPDEWARVASQLISDDDLRRMNVFLKDRRSYPDATDDDEARQTKLKCICASEVTLGTRIATFSYRKALDFPMFQRSWLAAEELLRVARRWVFIGYSLPAADYEFKYLLKRTQLSRGRQPELIVISGGQKKSVSDTYSNYQRFFGRSIQKSSFFSSGLTSDAVAAARG